MLWRSWFSYPVACLYFEGSLVASGVVSAKWRELDAAEAARSAALAADLFEDDTEPPGETVYRGRDQM